MAAPNPSKKEVKAKPLSSATTNHTIATATHNNIIIAKMKGNEVVHVDEILVVSRKKIKLPLEQDPYRGLSPEGYPDEIRHFFPSNDRMSLIALTYCAQLPYNVYRYDIVTCELFCFPFCTSYHKALKERSTQAIAAHHLLADYADVKSVLVIKSKILYYGPRNEETGTLTVSPDRNLFEFIVNPTSGLITNAVKSITSEIDEVKEVGWRKLHTWTNTTVANANASGSPAIPTTDSGDGKSEMKTFVMINESNTRMVIVPEAALLAKGEEFCESRAFMIKHDDGTTVLQHIIGNKIKGYYYLETQDKQFVVIREHDSYNEEGLRVYNSDNTLMTRVVVPKSSGCGDKRMTLFSDDKGQLTILTTSTGGKCNLVLLNQGKAFILALKEDANDEDTDHLIDTIYLL